MDYLPDPQKGYYPANDFFGGTLAGIQSKLPYLHELGVEVLYLNPIFSAYSNHRYDCADYENVDPVLGTNEDFSKLCRAAKAFGIRVILDGVFSHTGSDSRYFNRNGTYPELGAYQSEKSPYYEWYSFNSFPDDYDCWWGVWSLPNVKELRRPIWIICLTERTALCADGSKGELPAGDWMLPMSFRTNFFFASEAL